MIEGEEEEVIRHGKSSSAALILERKDQGNKWS